MAAEDLLLSLSGPEAAVLSVLRTSGEGVLVGEKDISAKLAMTPETVRGSLERLKSKKLVASSERHARRVSLTQRGEEAVKSGLPERRLLDALSAGPLSQQEVMAKERLDEREFAVAVGQLKRIGAVAISDRLERLPNVGNEPLPEEKALDSIRSGIAPEMMDNEILLRLVKRGLAATETVTERSWSVSADGMTIPLPKEGARTLGALTSHHLRSKEWKDASLRPYDVRANVPYMTGARSHDYLSWLREFEEILIGLGFEEWRGPLVETEFYNSDALFIPQHHPARTMQDVLMLKGIEGRHATQPLLDRVANVHEGKPLRQGEMPLSAGWGENYVRELSMRPLLRSHNTPVSVRYLLTHPAPPFRMYSIGAAFRRDAVDATHHIQFDQCEGVYGGAGVSLRNLLGLFTDVAKALGVGEIRFKPTYFPFTEPSVEGYVKHPSLGWIEVIPGGMFRPEVLKPLGVEVPVAAWGIGIMRLALVALGIRDIREIYTNKAGPLMERRV